MMRERSVRPLPEIDAVQNVAVGAVLGAGNIVDMDAEDACECCVAFDLVGYRAGDPRCLRLPLPRRAVVQTTVLDRHPELIVPEAERHSRIRIAGRLEDRALYSWERGRLTVGLRRPSTQRRRSGQKRKQNCDRAKQ